LHIKLYTPCNNYLAAMMLMSMGGVRQ